MQSDLVHLVFLVLAEEFTDDGHAEEEKYDSAHLQKQDMEYGHHRAKESRCAGFESAENFAVPSWFTAQFAECRSGTEAQ